MDLILPVKREYFDAIKYREKLEDFRLCTPYWAKRLKNKSYNNIIITLGYPKKNDQSRRIIRKWKISPWVIKEITHPHFGSDPVFVFAIDVS